MLRVLLIYWKIIVRIITREKYANFFRWKMGEYDISIEMISFDVGIIQCNKNGIAYARKCLDAGYLTDYIDDGIERDEALYAIRNLAAIADNTSDFAKFSLDMAHAVSLSSEAIREIQDIYVRLPLVPTISESLIARARQVLAEVSTQEADGAALLLKEKISDLRSIVRAGDIVPEAIETQEEAEPGLCLKIESP